MLELRRLPVTLQKTVGEVLQKLFAEKTGKNAFDKRVAEKAAKVFEHTALLHTNGIPKLVVDNTADGVIGSFYDGLGSIIRVLNDRIVPLHATQKVCRDAALRLRQTAFPNGKRFLRADMTVQYTAFRKLVSALESEALAQDIKTLGLEYQVSHLKAHLKPYGHAATAPDGSSIEKASDDWHSAYESFAIAVRDRYESDALMQTALLGPYQKELDAHIEEERVARARRKAKKNSDE